MSHTDPLLRALAKGDERCPDGQALSRLGSLVRGAGQPQSADLQQRVRQALAQEVVDADAVSEVEAERLGLLVRGIRPPKPVDLRARVRAALAPRSSLRLSPQAAAQTGRRWRLWGAVAAAHVAALLLITAALRESHHDDGLPVAAAPRPVHPGQTVAADSWINLRTAGGDLLAPRRDAERREAARAAAGMASSADTTAKLTAWLQAAQDPATGRIGPALTGERSVAVQSLATLALLGEGLGDRTRLEAARRALGTVAAAAAGTEPLGTTTLGAAALALVEGALLLDDAELRLHAQAAILRLGRELPGRPGEAGLGGLSWLALEVAVAGGLEVPPRALEDARRRLARSLPVGNDDVGRVGLAAFARCVHGQRNQSSTREQLMMLAGALPQAASDGRIDPLAWFFATLAEHEAGAEGWALWARALQNAVQPTIVAEGAALAHVPAAAVRHADGPAGDVLATALVTLALQSPYRYQTLSREE